MMNLTCAILHSNPLMSECLEAFIMKTPVLSLCGKYAHSVEALKGYYEHQVQLYFIEIKQEEVEGVSGMEFCRLLSPSTRVVFVADTPQYAADCFRLDALDYLVGEITFLTFFESVNKASRWFRLKEQAKVESTLITTKTEATWPEAIYMKSNSRIVRVDLSQISYIEGLGDYVKIYCKDELRPILSLCSMKYMEEKLPSDDFIRVHRSFIIRKDGIRTIENHKIILEKKSIPIGEVYRKKLKSYISNHSVL